MVLERNRRSTWRRWLRELRDALGGRNRVNWEMYLVAAIERVWRCIWRPRLSNSEMHLEAVIGPVWRCTWRSWSSELRDTLGGRNWASVEMQLEAMIVRTWRPWLVEFGDALGGHDWVSSDMRLEAVIDWVQRCTWRPWLSEFRDALGGYDWWNVDEDLEVVDLEAVDQKGGATAAETLFIG